MLATQPRIVALEGGKRVDGTGHHRLEEAVVVEQASVMEMRVDRRVFHVGNDLTNRGGNTTELLENIPSVNVDIDGNITLRGSAGVQISSTAALQGWLAGPGKPSWNLCLPERRRPRGAHHQPFSPL